MPRLLIGATLLFAVCFSTLVRAQHNYSFRTAAPPSSYLLSGKVEQKLLPAPPALTRYGAYFYNLLEESGAHASIFLYDNLGGPQATIEFDREIERGGFFLHHQPSTL